jgi:hypothetical protein
LVRATRRFCTQKGGQLPVQGTTADRGTPIALEQPGENSVSALRNLLDRLQCGARRPSSSQSSDPFRATPV